MIFQQICDILPIIISVCAVVISYSLLKCNQKNLQMQEEHYKMIEELQKKQYHSQEKHNKKMKKIQKKHNFKSVQPICNIECQQMAHSIKIKLKNCGLGSMIIKRVLIEDKLSHKEYSNLFELFPDDINLYKYSIDVVERGISANGYILLLEIIDISDSDIERIRNILEKCEILVEYVDIYNKAYKESKNLHSLFGKTYRQK